MGFDPTSVVRVIHAKPPRNLSQYLQEIGRAGRRGQKSVAILYHNKRDIAKNIAGIEDDIIQYCKNNKCLREMLLVPFGFQKRNSMIKKSVARSVPKKVLILLLYLMTLFKEVNGD